MNKIRYCVNENMAIDILELIKRGGDENFNVGGKQKYIEALEMSIEALEKQIPKKPILDKEQTMRYVTTYTCPACGKGFTGAKVCSYCYHCGQALDWSDEG